MGSRVVETLVASMLLSGMASNARAADAAGRASSSVSRPIPPRGGEGPFGGRGPGGRPSPERMFDAMDANHDGSVSRAEFVAHHARRRAMMERMRGDGPSGGAAREGRPLPR